MQPNDIRMRKLANSCSFLKQSQLARFIFSWCSHHCNIYRFPSLPFPSAKVVLVFSRTVHHLLDTACGDCLHDVIDMAFIATNLRQVPLRYVSCLVRIYLSKDCLFMFCWFKVGSFICFHLVFNL